MEVNEVNLRLSLALTFHSFCHIRVTEYFKYNFMNYLGELFLDVFLNLFSYIFFLTFILLTDDKGSVM